MSHFTVMVIDTTGKLGIEESLAPYQENNMGDCPREFMEFQDREDEYLNDYETGTTERVRDNETGELLSPYDNRFKLPKEGKEPFENDKYEVTDTARYTKVTLPFKEVYSTFEQYVEKYEGVSERTENEKGELRYGYYHNPNSKWDWYQVGGRWAGTLILKEGVLPKIDPNPSWGWTAEDRQALKDGKKVDVARKHEVNWEGMMAQGRHEAITTWEKVADVCGTDDRGHIKQPVMTWKQFMEKAETKELTWEDARKAYHEQPEVKKFAETKAGGFFGSVADFDCTKEEYGRRGADNAISTFAVLIDGEWKEKGSMGWWGMSSATEEDEAQWRDSFYDTFIKDIPDNSMITIVDCHI